MPRHRRIGRRISRHRRISRSRQMSGGAYSSASTYGEYVNGSPSAQYNRTFDQGGPYGQIQGNHIIGAQGQNVPPASQMPNSQQLNLVQSAGRRRHSRSRRHRRGGFLGHVVNQAVVPFALLGMQQTYRKRKGGRRHSRRRSHRRY